MLRELVRIKSRKTGRFSSWDTSERNADSWDITSGDFFGLGHGLVNSYQSMLFSAPCYFNSPLSG